ncbi:PAQR family membrane homeostasis protein TrhA [Variovorax boronicumulans]|uniref:PAQR family membrane homeostasis protein TrhA n=1 Tax=Variovorax boronicumulans TaxID=436515 RepID=UPI001C57083A
MHEGERLNTCTHALGLLLALGAAVVLVGEAAASDDAWRVASFSVFAAAMVALYTASTLFHGTRGRAKAAWARADHCAIYLMIAGTYTPLALVALRGVWGWGLFAAVWAAALYGVARELLPPRERPPAVALYVLMGWVGLAAVLPIVERFPAAGLPWLLAGALLYTGGVLFYARDGRWRHAHGVWHLFVLGGSASHCIALRSLLA